MMWRQIKKSALNHDNAPSGYYPFHSHAVLLLLLLLMLLNPPLFAATPWQKITQPIAGSASSIGGFSNGCIVGAVPLPLQHADYQVMRTGQLRYFGHPTLVHFIERLAKKVKQKRLGSMLIGDMGMPAGGRFASGHASHQTGLDVDIWLQLLRQRWSVRQLEQPKPLDLVSANGMSVNRKVWRPEIATLIRLAAEDPEVSRIFVHPAIKKELCDSSQFPRPWLRKVRPWFGHRAHMHVRLACPVDSLECIDQPPPIAEECGKDLESWLKPEKTPKMIRPTIPKPQVEPPLPAGCQRVLDNYLT